MLILEVPESEFFFEETNEFKTTRAYSLQLEHSLVSLAKWESKWKKPFLSSEKTKEESLDYIRCMTITPSVPPYIYTILTKKDMDVIMNYISDSMTATTFRENDNKKHNREVITSELIYYWMISLNIPFECRKWHLNQLLTLIRVCGVKNGPQQKMTKQQIAAQNRSLNAARRSRYNTRG